MKKLGYGMMRLPLTDPKDSGSIDIEATKKMVDLFLARGFTYFDTAWGYHDFQSENAVRLALTARYPRDSYTLATKLHHAFVKTPEDRDRIFAEQLKKTGVDYFDYYLLHAIGDDCYEKYEQLDCFAWLAGKKAAGLVRHMGCSFHGTPALLDRMLTAHPELEFVQLQLNYLDWDSPRVRARECYETCVRHGKPVIVMEPVKGGNLVKLPPAAEKLLKDYAPAASIPSWAVRFAGSLDNVMMVLSGMSSMDQVEDNTAVMESFEPLTAAERDLLEKAAEILRTEDVIACTGCSYCTEGCPMKIAIPRYFSLYNAHMRGQGDAHEQFRATAAENGKPADCIACGQCEGICPQHLPIIEDLRLADRALGW